MPSNYSLFRNNSAVRSAELNKKEEGIEVNRPTLRRSNLAGSAARAMQLADEQRKRRQAESQAPGEGERPEQSIGTDKQISMGIRVGGGKTFERAKRPEPQAAAPVTQPVAAESVSPAPPKSKSGLGGAFAKLFSVFGGDK